MRSHVSQMLTPICSVLCFNIHSPANCFGFSHRLPNFDCKGFKRFSPSHHYKINHPTTSTPFAHPVHVPHIDDSFDSSSGYGDMTGLKSFDNAWIEAFRKKDRIRCPFWRRRAVDALEVVLGIARFLISRHKTLDVTPVKATGLKSTGLSIDSLADIIRGDFENRQYYVTGRLTKAIYADNCFFDAPDPDMPVTGLRKYVDATSHLFEHRSSRVDLLSLEVVGEDRVVARWRLEGTLMLPWRPRVKAYTGVTVYTRDAASGLIRRHEERWSITALDAFASALMPVHWPAAVAAVAPLLPAAAAAALYSAPVASADALRALPLRQQTPDPAPLLAASARR